MGLLSRVSTFGSNWLFFLAFLKHYVTTRHSPAGTAATACCKGDVQTGRTGRLQAAGHGALHGRNKARPASRTPIQGLTGCRMHMVVSKSKTVGRREAPRRTRASRDPRALQQLLPVRCTREANRWLAAHASMGCGVCRARTRARCLCTRASRIKRRAGSATHGCSMRIQSLYRALVPWGNHPRCYR